MASLTIDLGALLKGAGCTQAVVDVAAERLRQVTEEGWAAGHDDRHTDGELAQAAAAYALRASPHQRDRAHDLWPWDDDFWKPKDVRSDLVRAGALILAEIERLDRASVGKESKHE